jgi:hypothetical protein
MRVMKHLVVGMLLIGLIVALAAYFGQSKVTTLGKESILLTEPQQLLVKPGSSFRAVIEELVERFARSL